MKFAIATIIILVFIAAVVFVVMLRRRGVEPLPALELRDMALSSPPADFGIQPLPGEAWGVVMDSTHPNGSASLLSLSDGSASLYFSNGGGIIGGQTHENVASAAKAFVKEAQKHLGQLKPATDFALPAYGNTRFFVRSSEGTLMTEAAQADLAAGKHPLSPLFFAGQEVVTQFREMSEKNQASP